MAGNWYYSQNGAPVGPMEIERLRGLIESGQVQPTQLVWNEGMPNWAPAESVPELDVQPAPTAPAATEARGYVAAAPRGYYPPQMQPQRPPVGYPTPTLGYATPAGYLAGPPLEYAGFWLRFLATIVDSVLLGLIGFGIGIVLGFVLAMMGLRIEEIQLMGNIVGAIVGFLYYTLQESGLKQGTPGKKLLGLKVTQLDGRSRISFGQAVGRYFAKWLSAITLCIGFMMAGFTERKQALHDMMASTLVVKG